MPNFSIDYLPLISLAGWLTMFAMKRRSLFAGDCAGLVYHLALLPVVRLLPGGPEVVFAGYLWLFSDALVDNQGQNRSLCVPVREALKGESRAPSRAAPYRTENINEHRTEYRDREGLLRGDGQLRSAGFAGAGC